MSSLWHRFAATGSSAQIDMDVDRFEREQVINEESDGDDHHHDEEHEDEEQHSGDDEEQHSGDDDEPSAQWVERRNYKGKGKGIASKGKGKQKEAYRRLWRLAKHLRAGKLFPVPTPPPGPPPGWLADATPKPPPVLPADRLTELTMANARRRGKTMQSVADMAQTRCLHHIRELRKWVENSEWRHREAKKIGIVMPQQRARYLDKLDKAIRCLEIARTVAAAPPQMA